MDAKHQQSSTIEVPQKIFFQHQQSIEHEAIGVESQTMTSEQKIVEAKLYPEIIEEIEHAESSEKQQEEPRSDLYWKIM